MHKNQTDIFKLRPHGLSFVLFLGGFKVIYFKVGSISQVIQGFQPNDV